MISPNTLEKLAAYVPMPVTQAIYREPKPLTGALSRRFLAVVLFADISGFTPLSELLSRAGPTGSEELTHLINQYFTRMIRIIEDYHGQVIKFSGDAMTVLFSTASSGSMQMAMRRAGECALIMQARMYHFHDIKTSQGRASLSMKVSIGAGEILECSIGGALGRWEYVVGGDPIVQMATAEHYAAPGQIVLSPQAWFWAKKFFNASPNRHRDEFQNLEKAITSLGPLPPISFDWNKLNSAEREQAEKALQCYIPGAIKARLNDQAEWLAELRRITILFIGLGGVDYEADDAGQRLQNFLQAAQEVTYRYEGSLGKVNIDDKGTVLLILFGAPPFFHEDDSARAVACALSLQTVARERHLRMSIGITEGSIFAGPVGAPSRREYTVIGDAVNLAARLMEYGRDGWITISERVKEKAGPQFIADNLGPISLKGKTDSLPAYQVKGEQGVQDEILNRYLLHEDPLVGRKAELEQLRRMSSRAREGRGQLLLVEGELGLGKSRLAAEMVREWMIEGGVGYGSKCMSYGQQIPYQGWREILIAIFGLTLSLSAEQKMDHLRAGLADLPAPANQSDYWLDRLPLLADVLGLDVPENEVTEHLPPELRRENTFGLMETIIRHQVGRRPLLILLEDVQWADLLTLELVAHLARQLVDQPLMMALIYRPEMNLDLLNKVTSLIDSYILQLEPLSAQESLDLVRMLLGKRSLPSEVEQVILSRGQGNPFFLQEMTGAILDVIGNQEKQTHDLLETLNLPDTVQDVILARVDRLSAEEKLTLKIASVIGTNFQRLLLSEIHPMTDAQYHLSDQLEKLEHANLLRLEQPAPKWEYVFRNVIAQEVIYEGLLLTQRQQLHAVVAEALENLAPDAVEQLAFHYKRANNWGKALHYFKIAGRRARREHANNAAIGYYSDILSCLVQLAPAKVRGQAVINVDYWDFLLERAKLYNLIGWRDEELEDLGTLGVMAEALNDDYRRALAAQQWATLYETSGDYDSGLELVERFVTLAHQVGDNGLLGRGYNQWGKLLYLRGKYDTATEYLQRALDLAIKCADKSIEAETRHSQGLVTFYQADYDQALTALQMAIELWREAGNRVGEGQSLAYLGQVYYEMGRYGQAKACYNESLTLHRSLGDRAGEALARHGLAKIERNLGNYPLARSLFEEALTFYQSIGDRHREAEVLYDLGFLHTRQAELDTALVLLGEALVILKELDAPWWTQVKALIYYSWALHEADCPEEAVVYITEAMEIERDTQQKTAMLEDLALMGRIALTLEDVSMADSCVQQILFFIEHQGSQSIEHPAMVYLTCYHILQATGKLEQAQTILVQAKAYVDQQAEQLADPALRENYLTNISENREIVSLSLAQQVRAI